MSMYFPMFVDLSSKRVLFAGAGRIAARRIAAILDFAGSVTVIAPEADPSVQALADAGRILPLQALWAVLLIFSGRFLWKHNQKRLVLQGG